MSEQEKLPETQAQETKSAKADKSAKPAKKKLGFFGRVARWFREMKSELKKVQWPTWKQTWNNTLTVIACVILVGIFLWVFDLVAREIIRALPELVGAIKG